VVMCYRNSLFKIIDIVDCVCLPVIYNYDKHSQYDLQLSVGDTVQIKESLTGECLTLLPAWLKSFLFESFCYAMLRRAQHCHGRPSVCPSVCDIEVSWLCRLENLENNFMHLAMSYFSLGALGFISYCTLGEPFVYFLLHQRNLLTVFETF